MDHGVLPSGFLPTFGRHLCAGAVRGKQNPQGWRGCDRFSSYPAKSSTLISSSSRQQAILRWPVSKRNWGVPERSGFDLQVTPLFGRDAGLAQDAAKGSDRHVLLLLRNYGCDGPEVCHFSELHVTARLTDLDKSGGLEAALYFAVWERIKRQGSRFQSGATEA